MAEATSSLTAVRNRNRVACLGDRLLAAAIAAGVGHDPLPKRQAPDAGADPFDGARDLRARRKWKRRRDLVAVAQNERVGEVEGDSRHLDEDFARSRPRFLHLLETQRLKSPEFGNLRHAHRAGSVLFSWLRQIQQVMPG